MPSVVQFSQRYFESLLAHAVPLSEAAIGRLSHSAMGLDVYTWLAQRLHRVDPAKPALVPWTSLQEQFVDGYDRIRDFRRVFLERIVPPGSRLLYARHLDADGDGLFAAVCREDLEGVVGKWKRGPYVDGPQPRYELGEDTKPALHAAGRARRVVQKARGLMDQVCTVIYANGMGHTTSGKSLFEAVAHAIEWAEVDCKSFGTARRIPDDEIPSGRPGGRQALLGAGRPRARVASKPTALKKAPARTSRGDYCSAPWRQPRCSPR